MRKTAYDKKGNHISLTQFEENKFEVRHQKETVINVSEHDSFDEANRKFYSFKPLQETVRPVEERPTFPRIKKEETGK